MNKPVVLIVDDDEVTRSLLRHTLPRDRYDVAEADNATAALALLAESIPALVMLDWRMPDGDGLEVLTELRKRSADAPVIMLTAERGAAARQVAEGLGASAFLTKPFSPIELLTTVERLLPEHRPE